MAIILRANKDSPELGGHIASFQSAGLLYDVGFNHFWHAPSADHGGDLVWIQGHSLAGHLRPFVPGGPAHRGAAPQVPPGVRRRRTVLVSAPVADARLLAVSDGVHGPRPDDGDLPGALPAVPRGARARRHRGAQGLGLSRRRRDATSPSRSAPVTSPRAKSSTTSSSSSTATCSASTARCAAMARSSRSLSRCSAARAGTSSSSCGEAAGTSCSPRTRAASCSAHGGMRRRRVPAVQGEGRRLRARAVLRQVP